MYKYGEEHPVIFEIILIIASFAVAAVFNIAGYLFNLHPDLSNSAARIITGIVLLVIYKRAYKGNHFFDNLVIVLPALLFPAWNIIYYLSSGIAFGGANFFIEGAITAIAPALFEEVIFRMIFIYNLKKKGSSDLQCLFISSALFAAMHLTNLAGMNPASVAVQTVYSFVIGMVFNIERKIENEINKKNDNKILLRGEIIKIYKCNNIIVIIFIISQFIIMAFFFFFVFCFCYVYPNNILDCFLSSLIVIAIIQLLSFINSFLIALIKYFSIKCQSELCFAIIFEKEWKYNK